MGEGDPADGPAGRRVKVARLIEEHDLNGLGAEMERRWTATGDGRMSLRVLADHFNQRLLTEAMAEAGTRPLAGEVENVYGLLVGDDVSSADRTRTRRRLEREGVDVDRLVDDFVTYQSIRTYLRDHRGAEYDDDSGDRAAAEAENIQRLRGRTATVTESKLEQLRNTGDIVLGEFRTLVDVRVVCGDCGGQYEVGELVERGGCDCDGGPES